MIRILSLLCALGSLNPAHARPEPETKPDCVVDLIETFPVRTPRPIGDLLDLVRDQGVTFNIATDGAGDRATYALAVRRGSVVLGSFLILKDESIVDAPVPVYETHSMLGFRGKGIGAALYVLAARMIHRRGGQLNSTDVATQSPDAVALWTRLESFGWVERVPGRDRYRVRPDLLASGFFDAVETDLDII